MYEITKGLDDKLHCSVRYQDGTERWVETDLKIAINAVRNVARTLNNDHITKKHIRFTREVATTKVIVEEVPWKV